MSSLSISTTYPELPLPATQTIETREEASAVQAELTSGGPSEGTGRVSVGAGEGGGGSVVSDTTEIEPEQDERSPEIVETEAEQVWLWRGVTIASPS